MSRGGHSGRGWQYPGETDAAFRKRIRAKAKRSAVNSKMQSMENRAKGAAGVLVSPENRGAKEAVSFGIPLQDVAVAKKAVSAVPDVITSKMTKGQHRVLLLTNFREFCAAGRIEDKTRAKVPFQWNKPQRKMNMLLAARLSTGKPVFAAIAKARRWGCSLDVTWWMGWQMCRKPGTAVCLVLHHKDYLDEFRNRYRSMFESLPEYVVGKAKSNKSRFELDNAQKLVLSNGSRVDFFTAGTEATASQVGRSTGYHWCHATEVPFWHAPEKTFTALMGSMQLGPHTGILVESTPCGAFGKFYNLYRSAKNGENDYIAYYVAWHDVEEYFLKPTPEQAEAWVKWRETKDDKWRRRMGQTAQGKPIVVEDTEGRIDRFALSCGQYLWWCDTLRNKYDGNIDQMKQEYGDDDVTCFLTAAKLGFEPDELALVKEQCDGLRNSWRDCGVAEDEHGRLVQVFDSRVFRVRQVPDPKAEYCALLDPALGGQTADFSVLYVFRRTVDRLELVAKCKTRAMPDGCVEMMSRLLSWYGDPLLAIESNKGEAHIHEFRVRNYPRLLRRPRINAVTGQQIEDALGLFMSEGVRQVCIKNLHKYLRSGKLIIPDDDFHSEMHTFVLDESTGKKYSAAKGCHDDHIMTGGMACYLDETYPLHDLPTTMSRETRTYLGYVASQMQALAPQAHSGIVSMPVFDERLESQEKRAIVSQDND